MELIKTYQSKNQLAQVMTSSLFQRRQEEAEAVIDSAISRLQVSFPRISTSQYLQRDNQFKVQPTKDTTVAFTSPYVVLKGMLS